MGQSSTVPTRIEEVGDAIEWSLFLTSKGKISGHGKADR
jgi:hypothetical protein